MIDNRLENIILLNWVTAGLVLLVPRFYNNQYIGNYLVISLSLYFLFVLALVVRDRIVAQIKEDKRKEQQFLSKPLEVRDTMIETAIETKDKLTEIVK